MSLASRLGRAERRVGPRAAREQAIVFIGLSTLSAPEIGVEPYGPDLERLAHRPGLAEFWLVRLDVRDWVNDRFTPEQADIIARAPGDDGLSHLVYCVVPEVGFNGDCMPMYWRHAVQWTLQARDPRAALTVHDRGPDGKLAFRCGAVLQHPAFRCEGYPEAIRDGWGRKQAVSVPLDDFASLMHVLWLGSKHIRAPELWTWHGKPFANHFKQSGIWNATERAITGRDGWQMPPDVMQALAELPEPPLWPPPDLPSDDPAPPATEAAAAPIDPTGPP